MNRKELIKKYIRFFKSKNHVEIKNSSLIPENDPTVLFTTAGMHPLVPFLLGQKHPQGKRLVNVQRCIRTGDIDKVGNTTHHTFFEMTGNWSLGDYWKKEAIEMSYEFAVKELKLPIKRIAITVFGGDDDFPQIPKDNEAEEIWKSLGIPKERIVFLKGGVTTSDDNWWGPAGKTGPCGPCTELFYWKLNNIPAPNKFDPEDNNWVEIWNDVLMEYDKDSEGNYNKAKQQNIDNGRGLERMLAVVNGFEDNYLAGIWKPIIKKIESISKKSYRGNEKEMRIIADHIKAATFIIADGVVPGNVEQSYVLRRLIRRAIRNLKKIEVPILQVDATAEIAKEVIKIYDDYEILQINKDKIIEELTKEEDRFQKTLDKGLKEFEKLSKDKNINGKESFLLYQSYGFPIEMIKELADEKNISVDEKGFEKELADHQKLSRTYSSGKFKSGLADNSETTKKLHTACHMLNEALRIVLDKPDIYQKGSNITPERLRFDFNFNRSLTSEELKEVENLVNLKIRSNLPVTCKLMPLKKAKESGAQGVFDSKYSENVRVYSIGNFSKEICAGPHVENTSELRYFKIIKEQSSSAGVRRIKAILE